MFKRRKHETQDNSINLKINLNRLIKFMEIYNVKEISWDPTNLKDYYIEYDYCDKNFSIKDIPQYIDVIKITIKNSLNGMQKYAKMTNEKAIVILKLTNLRLDTISKICKIGLLSCNVSKLLIKDVLTIFNSFEENFYSCVWYSSLLEEVMLDYIKESTVGKRRKEDLIVNAYMKLANIDKNNKDTIEVIEKEI